MAAPLPGLAAPDVAKLLTENIKRPNGTDAPAFELQAEGLKALRTRVLENEDRLGAVEGALARLPFPFGAPS